MIRMHEGRLAGDPHEQRAEAQAQQQEVHEAQEVKRRAGRRYESLTVREAVLAASERRNGPSPAREVQVRGRGW